MRNGFDDDMVNGGFTGLLEAIFNPESRYIHSPASMSTIINSSRQVAQESPEIEGHKTYIVSFPARIVTVISIDKGMVTCFDKGYVDTKKAG